MTDQSGSLRLGVTFHSFTAEFVSYVWSFEDLMVNAAQLGGGVEIVGPVHHRGFPHVPQEFVAAFRSSVDRNGLTPTCYGSYADPFMLSDRDLSAEELVEYTIPQIEGAARLGFPIVRLQHFAAEIVEQLLPVAVRHDVTLGYELHAPLDLESARTAELVEQVRRLACEHLGLIPDAGIFAHAISAHHADRGIEAGLSEADRDAVIALWSEGEARDAGIAYVQTLGAGAEAEAWAAQVWGAHGRSDPADLRQIADLMVHVHAKFYELAGGEDPGIRYRDLVHALIDNGYRGWISSEYEGPPTNSFEMVVGQQQMIRRYERDYRARGRA